MQRRMAILGLAAVLAACGGSPSDGQSDSAEESIVRGSPEDGFPQVVLLQTRSYPARVGRCSGTYIGPRMVLTAAHCLPSSDLSAPDENYVYFGQDYETDLAQLPNIPPPGQPSSWARVQRIIQHPDYDAALNYPDLAIAYLDRMLPFAPMPLYRQRVSNAWLGKLAEIVGWGGTESDEKLTNVTGVGVKRSGFAEIAGTPTEADYHADDPNAGMLDPAIRPDWLKLIGTAPNANPCAGDSGSPMLLRRHGFNQVAGVSFWTGLYCEDYGIYTRIDPFLSFLDRAPLYLGAKPIVPTLDCVEELPNGSLRAYLGYQNQNGISVTIAYNRFTNFFPKDTQGARPTVFAPGDLATVFGVDFAASDQLSWRLGSPVGRKSDLRVDASAPRCSALEAACIHGCEAQGAAQCDPPVVNPRQPLDACVKDCLFFGTLGCEAEWAAINECIGQLSPDPINWYCDDAMVPWNVASGWDTCLAEWDAWMFCPG
jgi:hypothetical protein